MKTVCILISLGLVALLAGCQNTRESTPVPGGSYSRTPVSSGVTGQASAGSPVEERLAQGANAETPSRLATVKETYDAEGKVIAREKTDVTLGTSKESHFVFPPQPNYVPYIIGGIGALALVAGGVLWGHGWPKMGRTLLLVGGGLVIISVTSIEYGWLYAIAAVILGGWIAWQQYSSYRKGESEQAKAVTPNAAA